MNITKTHPARKHLHRFISAFVFFWIFIFAGAFCKAPVSAYGAVYVKQSATSVNIRSSHSGWQQINGSWYFYNSDGRMMCGVIQYDNNYYYSGRDGKRITGWMIRKEKKYYYDPQTGIMFRNRWASGSKYTYYFNNSGIALTSRWFTDHDRKYYFCKNSAMATGWKKIGDFYYHFDRNTGVLSTNTWIGRYYVNSSGQRLSSSANIPPSVSESPDNYTYRSSTLSINLTRKSVHGVFYWVAHIKTASASQIKSALSYGTYGGTRQTTSSAVSSNGGIIGVNGSAFDYASGKPSPLGMCIKNGTLYGDYMTSYSVMAVNRDGVIYTPAQGLMGKDLLAAGVKDTYNFGPVLIQNGQPQLPWAETEKYYPRTAVGMVKPNDYVLLVTDTGNYSGLNHWDMLSVFQSYHCQYAYNLDGGGSSTLYFNGRVMNHLIGNYERPCADYLYFTR